MPLLTPRSNAPAGLKTRSDAEILAMLDGGYLSTASGALINDDAALRQATVWACVRILSESIAMLPIYLQRQEGTQWRDVNEHAAAVLLRQPNDWQTTHEFFAGLVAWTEMRGNGYAIKASASPKLPVRALLPLQSSDVTVQQSSDWSIAYKVSKHDDMTPAQIMHLRNFSKNGYEGLSTIAYARESIGLALRAEQHGAALFKNGAQIGKVLTIPKKLGDERIAEVERQLAREYSGAENSHKTLVLDNGAKLETVGMTLEDAQFVESRRMQKQEIASIFGVPLFLLNDTEKSTTWGTGLEQLSKAFVRYTLNPRLSRISGTLKRHLLNDKERGEFRFVFDTDKFTLGDFKERMEGYRSGIEAGVINANEAREMEGRSPREGGDEYRIPMNIGNEGGTQS